MSLSFESFNLRAELLKAIEKMGYTSPTTVQAEAIPIVLGGRDVIVKSKTGSGKTAAFGIPLLNRLTGESGQKPRALIITPTRELAVQVDGELGKLSQCLPYKTTAVYGQHNINKEYEVLQKGVDIVSGTPGRVIDHIKTGNLLTEEIEYFCIDEADKMLDMGFIDQVVTIIEALPKKRMTLLFSATMPLEIQHICKQYMNAPETIAIASETETVDAIEQIYHRVERDEKRTQLKRVLSAEKPRSCMVFCNTRYAVDRVCEDLKRRGYAAAPLHGAISQSKRLHTINDFKKDKFSVLVATDVAARGIHVDDLALVVNYDVPVEKDSYVHRIGRTGRAGSGGKAITLVTKDDLMSLYEIEEHIGVLIEEVALPKPTKPRPTSHQVGNKTAKQPKASGDIKRQPKQKPKHKQQREATPAVSNFKPQRVVTVDPSAPVAETKAPEVVVVKPWYKRLFSWIKK